MRLLKIIIVIFAIYFIRRFFQMYKVMKQIQEEQLKKSEQYQKQNQTAPHETQNVVNADFKIID